MLVYRISDRVGRYLERQGLLVRDMDNSYLTLESHDDTAMGDLIEHSNKSRIAAGSHQGQKAFTLQALASSTPVLASTPGIFAEQLSVYEARFHGKRAMASSAQKANVLGFMGHTDAAVSVAKSALRLNPNAPGYYHLVLGRGYLGGLRYAEALGPLETAVGLTPAMPQIRAALAVVYRKLGRVRDAEREVASIVQAAPMFTCSFLREVLPYREQDVLNDQIATLAAIGLPEGIVTLKR